MKSFQRGPKLQKAREEHAVDQGKSPFGAFQAGVRLLRPLYHTGAALVPGSRYTLPDGGEISLYDGTLRILDKETFMEQVKESKARQSDIETLT